MARHSIMGHHKSLLNQLVSSLETTQEAQKSTFAALPKAEPSHEIAPYKEYRTLTDIVVTKEVKPPSKIPSYTVLRCALADFAAKEKQPTTEELFQEIGAKLPWVEADTSYCVGRPYGAFYLLCLNFFFVSGPAMDDAFY